MSRRRTVCSYADGSPPPKILSSSDGIVYKIGGSIVPPKLIYGPDPKYTAKAKKNKLGGTVVIQLVIDQKGKTRNVQVIKPVGDGLDEEAVKAVELHKFQPATLNGNRVAMQVNIELNFHRY